MTDPAVQRPILRIDNLAVSFPAGREARDRGHRVRAVNDVNLSVYPNQTLAVVGESGSGKSVTALSILRLVPTPPGQYDAGHIWWQPEASGQGGTGTPPPPPAPIDLLKADERQMRQLRGNQIAMIFQEPMTSLNPVFSVGDQILEAILLHQPVNRKAARDIALQALRDVGISDPLSRLRSYPHHLSGGMRQRVMIAMALACQPRLLLADEPTTALDVTIQAQILELLRKLQQERNMSVMLITHDLGVVAENADVVAVMYAGRIVEYGTVHDVFQHPLHPYTRGLFASIPVMSQKSDIRLTAIPGNVPNPSHLPTGCAFHPRCAHSRELAASAPPEQTVTVMIDGQSTKLMRDTVESIPPLREAQPGHWAACWHSEGHEQAQPTPPDRTYRRSSGTGVPPVVA